MVCRAVFTAAQELFAESGVKETGEEFVLDVSMVHVAHARIQERLNCFAQLVHAQPDIVARLLDTIPPDESEMVSDSLWPENKNFSSVSLFPLPFAIVRFIDVLEFGLGCCQSNLFICLLIYLFVYLFFY